MNPYEPPNTLGERKVASKLAGKPTASDLRRIRILFSIAAMLGLLSLCLVIGFGNVKSMHTAISWFAAVVLLLMFAIGGWAFVLVWRSSSVRDQAN